MKKIAYYIFVFCCLLFILSCASPQNSYKVAPISRAGSSNTENKFIYALPKTIINIDVIVLKQEKTRGPYADFGQKLLGINVNDITSNNQTNYSFFDARVHTNSEPDPEQYYFVDPQKSNINVSISATGIIQSVGDLSGKTEKIIEKRNILNLSEKEEYINTHFSERNPKHKLPNTPISKSKKSLIADFPKEEMPSKKGDGDVSLKKQAEEAADFINKIRQKKIELLSGEYDDQYSSFATEFMYKNLDSIEHRYLELFTGTIQVSLIKESFSFEPQRSKFSNNESSSTLFKFSETEGILPLSSSSGIPFVVNVKCKNNLQGLNYYLNTTGQKSSEGFYYRIPEQAIISIHAGALQKDETVLISQFGTIMNLPKAPINALFDPETGNVLRFNISH